MTNLEKFIEVMNQTFDARFKPEHMRLDCTPCGALKIKSRACNHFKCESCEKWWHKEYRPIFRRTEQCEPEHAHPLDGEE